MTKFAHIRPNLDPRSGGYTIAFHRLGPRYIEMAIARCNPKDNFNKALGREIAQNRLNFGNSIVFESRAKRYANIIKKAIELANVAINIDKLKNRKQNKG